MFLKRLFFALLLLLPAFFAFAPGWQTQNDQVTKGKLIYKLSNDYVDWPDGLVGLRPNDPIVVKVIGNEELATSLRALYANQRIKDHPVQVKVISSAGEIGICHILFVGSKDANLLMQVLEKTRNRPILTFSDTTGYGQRGILLNFFQDKTNVRFEYNVAAFQRAGLRMSYHLSKYGIPVSTR